jgi:hypothetical protein
LDQQPDVIASAIFIMGGTPDWQTFWLPVDSLGPIAEVYSQAAPEPRPPETKEGNMQLIQDGEYVATCGQSFTATMHLEHLGQVWPIEGIATAFLRAPRDAEGYTLGFMDQISFDAENLDLEVSDVDGHFQFTFAVPEFTISAPTMTELFVSVLSMDRTMQQEPFVVEGTFPLQLLPANSDGEGGEAADDSGALGGGERSPPSVWASLAAIFAAAATIANAAPSALPDVETIHRAVNAIKIQLGFSEGDVTGTIGGALSTIAEAAGRLGHAYPHLAEHALTIVDAVATIREVAGNFR